MKQILMVLFIALTTLAHASWTPPPQPNPQQILQDAEADERAGRYEDALAKQVWFHENALKGGRDARAPFEPALYGVRLSFALSAWATLGAAYPPALDKLKSIRDEAAAEVVKSDGTLAAFHDFASINKTVGEDAKTSDLFIWLDSHEPGMAKKVFDLAEPSLIRAKQYHLCGKYVEPDSSYNATLKSYRERIRSLL